jgi:hypothetical protein
MENKVATDSTTKFRVASTTSDTTFSFVVTGDQNTNHVPYVTAHDQYNKDFDYDFTFEDVTDVDTDATTGNNRFKNKITAGKVSIKIPADYVGEITVTATSSVDSSKSVSFTLEVQNLKDTISEFARLL